MVEILATLFARAQGELMGAQPGDLTAIRAHARMLGLKDIRDGFESILNDEKVAASLAERKTGSS